MGYDRTAPKRPLNVSINEDLIRQARIYTTNLSSTLETLLQAFVAQEETRRREDAAAVDRIIDFFGAFNLEHGLLSDEFQDL